MNEPVNDNNGNPPVDNEPVTDTNTPNPNEPVTDTNTPTDGDPTGTDNPESDAPTSTDTDPPTDSDPDPTDTSGTGDPSDGQGTDEPEGTGEYQIPPDVQEIIDKNRDRSNRLADRLAQSGRDRQKTEEELAEIREENEQLRIENEQLRNNPPTYNGNQPPTGGADMNQDRGTGQFGSTDLNDTSGLDTNSPPTYSGSSDRETQLEHENRILRQQITDVQAEQGGFYEELSADPDIANQQILHNQKLMRQAVLEQDSYFQNTRDNSQHQSQVALYTDQGVDAETAELLVANDIAAMEETDPGKRAEIMVEGKRLWEHGQKKAASDAEKQRLLDEAREQQLADRGIMPTPTGQGATPSSSNTSALDGILNHLKTLETYDEQMDYIEEVEKQYSPEVAEQVLAQL